MNVTFDLKIRSNINSMTEYVSFDHFNINAKCMSSKYVVIAVSCPRVIK